MHGIESTRKVSQHKTSTNQKQNMYRFISQQYVTPKLKIYIQKVSSPTSKKPPNITVSATRILIISNNNYNRNLNFQKVTKVFTHRKLSQPSTTTSSGL